MLNTILIGLAIGGVMVLIAAGLSLAFGMLGVVNFAHGALYMTGAFVAVEVIARTGGFMLGLIAAPVAVALLAALIEVTLLRRIYQDRHESQLLLTFGLLILIEEVARAIWGLDYRRVEIPVALAGQIEMLSETVPIYRLFVLGCGGAVALGLVLMIERTQLGMVLRATMTNPRMVRGVGINVAAYRTIVFALGGALAALGGVIAAPILPVQVNMGGSIILDSFIVVIVGGLGNVIGVVLASFGLGLLRAFGQQYAAAWVDTLTYVLLVLALILRPQGLVGIAPGRPG